MKRKGWSKPDGRNYRQENSFHSKFYSSLLYYWLISSQPFKLSLTKSWLAYHGPLKPSMPWMVRFWFIRPKNAEMLNMPIGKNTSLASWNYTMEASWNIVCIQTFTLSGLTIAPWSRRHLKSQTPFTLQRDQENNK